MSEKKEIDYPQLMASMAELKTDMSSVKDGLTLLRNEIHNNNERIQDKLDKSSINVDNVKDRLAELNVKTTTIDTRTSSYVTYKQMLTIVVTLLTAISIILGIVTFFLNINSNRNDDRREKNQSKRQTACIPSKRLGINEGIHFWNAANM